MGRFCAVELSVVEGGIMTIEEAIKILENRKKQPFISYQQKEAFQMGINALKKEQEELHKPIKKSVRL